MISTFLNYCVYELCIRILLDKVISNFNRYDSKSKMIDYIISLSKEIQNMGYRKDTITVTVTNHSMVDDISRSIDEDILQSMMDKNDWN